MGVTRRHLINRWPPQDLRDWVWCLFRRKGKAIRSTNLGRLRQAARPLLGSGGYAITQEGYSPLAFGNALVVLTGPKAVLRLVMDRGISRVDVAAPAQPDHWRSVNEILGERTSLPDGLSEDPVTMVEALVANLRTLEQRLSASPDS